MFPWHAVTGSNNFSNINVIFYLIYFHFRSSELRRTNQLRESPLKKTMKGNIVFLIPYLQVKMTTAVKNMTNFGCVAQNSPCSKHRREIQSAPLSISSTTSGSFVVSVPFSIVIPFALIIYKTL